MGDALTRGRTLDRRAVDEAHKAREERKEFLKDKLELGTITKAESRELRWKWGFDPNKKPSPQTVSPKGIESEEAVHGQKRSP